MCRGVRAEELIMRGGGPPGGPVEIYLHRV